MSDNSEQTQSQTDVSSGEQLVGFVPIQSDANNMEVPVQLVGAEGEDDIYFGSQAIELNGERHVIVSQAQDPETGEILLVLQGENGEHIAIQPETLNSMVQASGEGGIQVAVVSQSDETGLTIATDVNSLTSTQSISASDLTPIPTTSIAILPSIIANIPSQIQSTTAPTNVVQAIDTPRVTAQEEQSTSLSSMPPINTSKESEKSVETPALTTVSETPVKKESDIIAPDINLEKVNFNSTQNTSQSKSEEITNSSNGENVSQQKLDVKQDVKVDTNEVSKPVETAVPVVSQEPEKVVPLSTSSEQIESDSNTKQSDLADSTTAASLQSTSEIGFGNTAVIQVQDSGNGTSLETLMANAMLSSDGNYVFMAQTEDGQMTSLPSDLNLSEVINAGTAAGQAFFIETPEGLVACTASASNEDGAIQLIPAGSGDMDGAVIGAQAQGNSVENQIIQAISGGQAMAYTFTSNSGCLELTPVSTPQTQTAPTKPTRGRCGRPPKSRTISPISSSMGQTLLLSTDNTVADGLTVSAKPTTPTVSTRGRGRGGGRGGRYGANNTSITSNTTFSPSTASTQQQLKSGTKIVSTTDSLKSSTTGVNSLSTIDTSTPGPSQLAASRRTYSKKSNIVWITPDPSQGSTNSSFSTIATVSTSKPSPSTKQTTLSTTNSSAIKNTSQTQSTTVSLSSPARTTSPSKAIGSTTPQTNTSITVSKATVSTPSSTKPITSTIASKSTTAVASTKANTLTTNANKATVPTTTASKVVTGSKTTTPVTTATKTAVQLTPKVITTSSTNKSTPVTKAQTIAKSTIKVSDITAVKTTVSTALPKTIASTTSVTKPIISSTSVTKSIVSTTTASKTISSTTSVTKSTTPTTSSTKTTASATAVTKPTVSTTSSSKTVASTTSETKPIVSTTTVTKATVSTAVSSVTKPIVSTTSASKTVSTPITTKTTSKTSTPTTTASKTSTSVSTSNKSVVSTPSAKEVPSKTKDSSIKAVVSTPIATKSSASTTSAIESIKNSNSAKNVSIIPTTEPPAVNESSSRLSPTKANSTKIETNISKQSNAESNKQIVTKIKLPQTTKNTDLDNSDKSKVQSINKSINEKEKSKTTLGLEKEPLLVTNDNKKSENQIIGINTTEGDSILAHKTSEKIGKKIDNEIEKSNEKEVDKSAKKTRRSSRSTEESKKEKVNTTVTEIKTNESKTKDDIIVEKPKEKVNETPVDSQKVATRRTSRKRDISSNLNDSKTVTSDPIQSVSVIPTTPTTSVNSSAQMTSGRVTRASSIKKTEEKPTIEPQDSKANKSIKEIPAKSESVTEKPVSDFDRIIQASKPIQKSTPEPIQTVLANSTETLTRSVKKKVQFEIKENDEEEKTVKIDEKVVKTPQVTAPISTRRSLRSSTPAVENKISVNETNKKVDKQVNELLDSGNKIDIENSTKTSVFENSTKTPVVEKSAKTPVVENSNKTPVVETSNRTTPQRFSARKRKEVPKSETVKEDPEERPTKSLRKASNKLIVADQSSPNLDKGVDSPKKLEPESQSLSIGRVRRDRKPKNITRIETKIPYKEPTRHSIETSEPTMRTNKKKSFFQSFINEIDSQEKEENIRRKTISSLSDLRSPNECYDYSTNECSFYIRHQSASLTPKQSGGNYLCQKCGFHTSRINNLVVHHRDQCSYVKNAVMQHWQSQLQKRVKSYDSSDTPTASNIKPKKRKLENNSEPVSTTSLDKSFDETDEDSDEEQITNKPEINEKPNQNPTISDIDAMLMGSDDEDLLSIDNIENPKREFGFAEDDIVWVEAHNVHWPALVSKIHPKEKKASIKLIDGPKGSQKSLKTSISSISLFDSAEMNKKYLRDGRKSVNGDLLVKAVQKAEDFLRKRCLGSETSAVKFFDQIDSDFSENYADDDDRVPITSTEDSSSNKDKETANTSTDDLAESTSSPVVSNDCDNDEERMSESNEAVAQWKERRRLQNAKLLQCIKDGKVETHLVGVYRETIQSERHQKFKSGSESEKNQLKHVPWFGPIDDEEQQEEIYDYCSQLFKSNFKTDGSFDTVAYIFEVWVPEAIVKAISRVRRIELKDSESIFAKGVILSKSEERRTQNELQKELQKEAEKQLISHSTSD